MSNILFVGMGFYEYETEIVSYLEKMGNSVLFFKDKNYFLSDKIGLLRKYGPSKDEKIKRYQNLFLKRHKRIPIDIVFVVVGRYLKEEFLAELKRNNKDAVFILYLWDDIGRVENFHAVYQYYDKIYSFDPCDCSKYGFSFLPLMYIERVCKPECVPTKDIYSAMYMHSDRMEVCRKIIDRYPNRIIKVLFKCNLGDCIKNKIRRLNNVETRRHFKFTRLTISKRKLVQEMITSKAVLDIQHPTQTGLTIRTFDVMSVGCKLITTNVSIKYYDFYNENNIAIIDRNNPVIPELFFEKPFQEIPTEIIKKYSLENWIEVVFGMKSETYLAIDNPYDD